MSDANTQLVKRGYEAYARGDFPAMFELLDKNVEVTQTPVLPWGGVYRGHEGAREFFQKLALIAEAVPEPKAYVRAGEDVVAVGHLKGRVRATGVPIDIPIVHVWTVRDDKVVRFAAYIDTPAMLAALAEGQ
jgi:hypothetical protein